MNGTVPLTGKHSIARLSTGHSRPFRTGTSVQPQRFLDNRGSPIRKIRAFQTGMELIDTKL